MSVERMMQMQMQIFPPLKIISGTQKEINWSSNPFIPLGIIMVIMYTFSLWLLRWITLAVFSSHNFVCLWSGLESVQHLLWLPSTPPRTHTQPFSSAWLHIPLGLLPPVHFFVRAATVNVCNCLCMPHMGFFPAFPLHHASAA